jgi:type II secretory ATPase GspE/PulE/Tfp pilus assembly ATPase PilB-like protein
MAELLVDKNLLSALPAQVAKELRVFPLREETGVIVVAALRGHDTQIGEDLAFVLGKNVAIETWPDEELLNLIQQHYGTLALQSESARTPGTDTPDESTHDQQGISLSMSGGSVVALVNDLISNAIRM